MFTKVYKEEDKLLRGCSYNVASVYFHLKNKRDYFKAKNNGTCYDLIRCISEYTGMCEKTVKRAISTLRELGLISTVIKGKVNHYSFPILDKIEGKTVQVEESKIETIQVEEESSNTEQMPDNINITEETINENEENMGTFIGYIETPTQDEKFDNFSDTLYKLIDEYESIINHTTETIAKAELSDDVVVVYQAKQAKLKLREISEKLIEEIDKNNFNKFIMERVEIKKKYIAA